MKEQPRILIYKALKPYTTRGLSVDDIAKRVPSLTTEEICKALMGLTKNHWATKEWDDSVRFARWRLTAEGRQAFPRLIEDTVRDYGQYGNKCPKRVAAINAYLGRAAQ